jgi:hypothetical protein
MAKNKRKLSSGQVDKYNIQVAKFLKKAGILSKRTNLNQGRYISKAALKKVKEYEYVFLNNYKAAKVSKSYLEKAKQAGYAVVNNRVIVPTRRNVEQRIEAGLVVGVIPVKGGTMESVVTPYSTLPELLRAMESGELDKLKTSDELFIWSIYGNASYTYAMDSAGLADFLMRYQSVNDALADPQAGDEYLRNLTIFRIQRNDVNRALNYGENKGKNRSKKNTYQKRKQRLQQMGDIAREREAMKKAIAQQEYRERLKETNPAKYQEQLARARARMAKNRATRK